MRSIKKENQAQAEALLRLHGNVLQLIPMYAEDFRRIIEEYEATHNGTPPTADDLIWLESERMGRDITKSRTTG